MTSIAKMSHSDTRQLTDHPTCNLLNKAQPVSLPCFTLQMSWQQTPISPLFWRARGLMNLGKRQRKSIEQQSYFWSFLATIKNLKGGARLLKERGDIGHSLLHLVSVEEEETMTRVVGDLVPLPLGVDVLQDGTHTDQHSCG